MSALAQKGQITASRRIRLDNRVFVPVDNSTGGLVDDRTRFHFWQDGEAFYADYFGGDVREGHIIGRFTGDRTGHMLYHCLTKSRELRAGRAVATFTVAPDGRLGMDLDWTWISGGDEAGVSRYEEVTGTGWTY